MLVRCCTERFCISRVVATRQSLNAWSASRRLRYRNAHACHKLLPQHCKKGRRKRGPTCTAAVFDVVETAVVRHAAALGHLWSSCLQSGVLAATATATFKLFLICGAVGALQRSGRISEDTAPVLSRVAFGLMIPCMLFTKVGATLAQNPTPSLLAIPLVAALQVGLGALLGNIASRFVTNGVTGSLVGNKWHPSNQASSAKAIAFSTAQSAGIQSQTLLIRSRNAPDGTGEMVTACCAFGNSLTLPLVFLMSLLPAAAFTRAAGYTALFLAGWSPLLWTGGYQLLSSVGPPGSTGDAMQTRSFDEGDVTTAQMALASSNRGSADFARGLRHGVILALRRRLGGLKRLLGRLLNPPLLGVLAGIAVGISPLGVVFFWPGCERAMACTQSLPMELGLCVGVGRAIVQVLEMMGGATLAVQAIVLAASLFQKRKTSTGSKTQQNVGRVAALPAGGSAPRRQQQLLPAPAGFTAPTQMPQNSGGQPSDGAVQPDQDKEVPRRSQNLLHLLLPGDRIGRRTLLVTSAVRLLVSPLASLAMVGFLARIGFLPADPVCHLVLLVQSAMPSAQNLVLLTNLKESTRFLAPSLATLLLRQYVLSVLPVTIWITVFVSRMPLALSAM